MTTFKIDSLEFKKLIKKTLPFCSTEESRYYLCGAYLEFDGKNFATLTATNGHILIQSQVPLLGEESEFNEQNAVSGIIPSSALKHIYNVISKETGGLGALVTFESDKSILFDFGDVQYRTKLHDAVFPDYSKVIPSGSETINHGFNPKYLKAVINALDGQPINIAVDDKESANFSPHLFSVSKDRTSTRCVIMPMRV